MRRFLLISAFFAAAPVSAAAQSANDQALARARAVDACNGRPVLSAQVGTNGRISVTCGDGATADATNSGAGLSAGAGVGAVVGVLLLLGLALGGSSDGT